MIDIHHNMYNARLLRSEPKFKIWRYAGLMLTYRCSAACRFCYYGCKPTAGGLMPVEMAVDAWKSLISLAGPQSSVHITGGEPFLEFDHLARILSAARSAGLPPLDSLETNGSWADDLPTEVRQKLAFLKSINLRELKISCDPFHAEFIRPETLRHLYTVACEVLGPDRVKIKWQKYLDNPVPYDSYLPADRKELCRQILKEDRCRFTGRAARLIAPLLADQDARHFASLSCGKAILGARGIHIDPYGNVFSGQCSGLIAGNLNTTSLENLWRSFDPANFPFWKTLFHQGPFGLWPDAVAVGYPADGLYASKCHLCSDIRRFYFDKRKHLSIIGPIDCYSQ